MTNGDTFFHELQHALKPEIGEVRRILVGADSSIAEAVKWNSLSYRTTDFFATVNLRSTDRLQLVFHTGAKVKATATSGSSGPDPAGLLKWLAKDRALVTLGVGPEIAGNQAHFEALVREWIRWV